MIGPGAQQEVATDIRPMLEGANEFEYVTILNPFTEDFAVRVGQDVPVNMPGNVGAATGLVQNDGDVIRNYGMSLKNPDFQGRKHISNDTVIKAGQTINLKGNEAQVAVKQIVDELMQREGNAKLMPDPTLRNQAEQRVVVSRGSIQELMDSNLRTERSQLDEAINKSNEVHDGEAFPGLREKAPEADSGVTEPDPDPGSGVNYSPGRVGRPKKTDS